VDKGARFSPPLRVGKIDVDKFTQSTHA
jgi:hypothetical protein